MPSYFNSIFDPNSTDNTGQYTFENKRLYLLSILLSAIAIMVPALINNFPFLYADTGTYIQIAYTDAISHIRPPLYGLFIEYVSLKVSLWLVIAAQALIVSWSIHRFIKVFFPKTPTFFGVLIISFLAFTSGIGVTTGMLMPDFMTPVMILHVIILLLSKDRTIKSFIMPCILLWFGVAVHHSHAYILFCTLFPVGVIQLIFNMRKKKFVSGKSVLLVALFTLLGYFTIPLLHYQRAGEFIWSKSSNVFLMNRISQMGLLKPFLDMQCERSDYPICTYKDAIPKDFLWGGKNPLYKDKGWEANNELYQQVVADFFSYPKYTKKFK